MSQEQRRPRPQPEPRGANVNSTLSVIVAVLSVLLGFFILRDIRGDGGGTVSAPAVTETTVAEGSVDTLPAVPTTAAVVLTAFKVQVANASCVRSAHRRRHRPESSDYRHRNVGR